MTEKILTISLCVFAIHYAMQSGEIFGFIGDWFHKVLPDFLHNPVYDCPVCMVPYYGSAVYWLVWGEGLANWVVVIIASLGLNAVIVKMFPKDHDPEEIKI